MQRTVLSLILAAQAAATPALSQSCGAEADAAPGIVEIVQFKLAEGISAADFTAAAASTMPFLCAADGFIMRQLTQGDDGLWTDYVVWTSVDLAQGAAEAAMQDETMMPFMMSIDSETIALRYEMPVLLE